MKVQQRWVKGRDDDYHKDYGKEDEASHRYVSTAMKITLYIQTKRCDDVNEDNIDEYN